MEKQRQQGCRREEEEARRSEDLQSGRQSGEQPASRPTSSERRGANAGRRIDPQIEEGRRETERRKRQIEGERKRKQADCADHVCGSRSSRGLEEDERSRGEGEGVWHPPGRREW